ncbi:MAG: polyprenol monophosphomannose synthase [Dehalococcoidia bacterium]
MPEPELTLVLPTLNERDNIRPLVDEIDLALDGIDWEAVFVDDSRDGTDAVIAAIAADDRRVRLVHRTGARLSLAGAVVAGFRRARGRYVCVLDADLQHPPERIVAMLHEARCSGADLVIASRYIPGGSAGGLAGPLRRFYSLGLKSLARACFPQRLARVTDPLGGFFLVRRELVRDQCLRPLGYKILLEVLVRTRWRSVREVPYRFRPRRSGLSKADLPQGISFLRHLARLVWSCSPLLAPVRAVSR